MQIGCSHVPYFWNKYNLGFFFFFFILHNIMNALNPDLCQHRHFFSILWEHIHQVLHKPSLISEKWNISQYRSAMFFRNTCCRKQDHSSVYQFVLGFLPNWFLDLASSIYSINQVTMGFSMEGRKKRLTGAGQNMIFRAESC